MLDIWLIWLTLLMNHKYWRLSKYSFSHAIYLRLCKTFRTQSPFCVSIVTFEKQAIKHKLVANRNLKY